MPFLRFKGFEPEFVSAIAPLIIEEVSGIVSIPKEIVKIELLNVHMIANSPRSIEILMFKRDQAIHDALAQRLNEMLTDRGYSNVHIFYVMLARELYYKEGKPLASGSTVPIC